jgi:hypothetical protein
MINTEVACNPNVVLLEFFWRFALESLVYNFDQVHFLTNHLTIGFVRAGNVSHQVKYLIKHLEITFFNQVFDNIQKFRLSILAIL